jgi:hypothetical protein
MNIENLSIEKWRQFQLVEPKKTNTFVPNYGGGEKTTEEIAEEIRKNISITEFQAKNKIKMEIEQAIAKQKKIFNEETKRKEIDLNAMSIYDQNEYMNAIYGMHLLSVAKVCGINQRIYKSSNLHCCWGMSLSNPYIVKQSGGVILKDWIRQIENMKLFLMRPPPIILQYVEDIKKKDFEVKSLPAPPTTTSSSSTAATTDDSSKFTAEIKEKKDSKYIDLAERLLTKTYRANGRLIRETLKNGDESISCQINAIEYLKETNEFGIFGKCFA